MPNPSPTTGSAANDSTGAATSKALPSFNLTAGQDVVVAVALGSTSSSVTSITDNNAGDFAPHNMTSNTAPSPFVAAASSFFSASFDAYKAFDGAAGSGQYWVTASGSTGWLSLDIGSGNSQILQNYSVQ